ncbi:MAG: CBS domain-containing protein, partial [Xanthobacteraceae bacterium]
MRADDVMTSNLVTVGEDASVRDVALVLLQNQISAVPVIDRMGNMVGIVSEGDLMRRPESETQKRRSPWLELLSSKQALAAEFVKMHSRRVTDVMTRGVITATPDTPVAEIASLLEKNGIKRVPILRGGKLAGIVSRANLLHGLASLKNNASKSVASDAAIRDRLLARLQNQPWSRPTLINVIVQDGIAELWGIVDSQAER